MKERYKLRVNKINIIIVDDNKEMCDLLAEYLSTQDDINVTGTGYDGIEALKLIQVKKPDLVIIDLIMPHLDGLQVLENLFRMNINQKPKIIVISAVSLDKVAQRALSLGADYYFVKPFDLRMLIKRIRELFNHSELNEITADIEISRII